MHRRLWQFSCGSWVFLLAEGKLMRFQWLVYIYISHLWVITATFVIMQSKIHNTKWRRFLHTVQQCRVWGHVSCLSLYNNTVHSGWQQCGLWVIFMHTEASGGRVLRLIYTDVCVCLREREVIKSLWMSGELLPPRLPRSVSLPPLFLLCQLLLVCGVIKMIGSCESDGVLMPCVLRLHVCICLQLKFNPLAWVDELVWVNGEDRKCQRSLTSSLSHLSHSVNPFLSLAHFTLYSVTAYRWIVGIEGMKGVWSQIGLYKTTCALITRRTYRVICMYLRSDTFFCRLGSALETLD